MARITLRIVTPRIGKYIFCENGKRVSIGELDEETARELGAEWTEKLVQKVLAAKDVGGTHG
jgi:hypothetical protein